MKLGYTVAGMGSSSLDELMSQTSLVPLQELSEDSKKSYLPIKCIDPQSPDPSISIPPIDRPLTPIPTNPTKLPPEILLSIYKHAVSSLPATIVKLDDFHPKKHTLYNTCFGSRTCFLQRYTIYHHPGIPFTPTTHGRPYLIAIDYAVDTIHLLGVLEENPLHRGIRLYSSQLKPVRRLAMSTRYIDTLEFIPNVFDDDDDKSPFWTKLMTACPELEKLTVVQSDGMRPDDARQRPESRGFMGGARKSCVRSSLEGEKARGRYLRVEVEWRHFVSDI